MSIRLITRVMVSCAAGINQCWAEVYYDTEGEYFVKFYRHTEYLGISADYHTSDKLDAIQTARLQCMRGY